MTHTTIVFKPEHIMAKTAFIASIAFIFLSIYLYKDTKSFVDNFEVVVDGVVKSKNDYRTIVEFVDQKGRWSTNRIIISNSSSGSNPASYSKGQKVKVFFDRNKPKEAQIKSFFSLWFGTIITGTLGFGLFLLMLILSEKTINKGGGSGGGKGGCGGCGGCGGG